MADKEAGPLEEELRKLAEVAREKETQAELEDLRTKIQVWAEGRLNPDKIREMVNEIHGVKARSEWKLMDFDDEFLVVRALYKKLLRKEDLSPELREALRRRIDEVNKMIDR